MAYLCVGDYSANPYLIQGLEIRVYCMEELCYGLKENAFLLDTSIMSDTLIDWIRQQCGLDELADGLYHMVHRKGSLSSFVTEILQYVGLYDSDVIAQVEQVLKKGAGLSNLEKRKEQIDYLVKKKKYMAAIRGYDSLLLKWDEFTDFAKQEKGDLLKADICHNKGVAYSRLMLYKQAAESFLMAYRLCGEPKEYFSFLAAKRLELPEKQYIAFASSEMEHYELTMELEQMMEGLRQEFVMQPEQLMLRQRKENREVGDKQHYYDETEQLCQALKNSYRIGVSE